MAVCFRARRLEHFELTLLGADDAPAEYELKLYFANVQPDELDNMEFKLQGQPLAGTTQVGTTKVAGQKTVTKQFKVSVKDNLIVDLTSKHAQVAPELCAIEVTRVERTGGAE